METMEIMPNYSTKQTYLSMDKEIEDAEALIDETFNLIKENENIEKSKPILNEDIKKFIMDAVKEQTNSKVYYEYELIKSYKERIIFLENQNKHLGSIISDLTKSHTLHKIVSENLEKTQSSIPEAIDINTPNLSLIEDIDKENIKEGECKLSVDDQLSMVRKDNHTNYLLHRKHQSSTKEINENKENKKSCLKKNDTSKKRVTIDEKYVNKKCVVLSDSMFNGIHEKSVSKNGNEFTIKYVSGAKVNDLTEHIHVIENKKPDVVVIHAGTNNAPFMTSNQIVDELLALKNHILKAHNCKVIISTPIIRMDDGKASYTIRNVNNHLKQLKVTLMDNSNITPQDLGKKGLHLSKWGKSKLAKNLVETLEDSVPGGN